MRLATSSLASALLCAFASACLVDAWPACAQPAYAQMDSREAISLQNQILELRHQLELNQGGGNGTPTAPPLGAGAAPPAGTGDETSLTPQLLDRVSKLEDQVRSMRGELDLLANQVQQQNAALTKQIGDLSFAVQQGGQPGSPAPAAAPAAAAHQPPAPAVPAPAVRRTPELALKQGNAALARRDYAAAEAAAREVLKGPGNPRQADARFLLAQSLAGQRAYQQAATTYYDVYSHAPRSALAPDALLGVSASLLALGDKTDACQALKKLAVEFPAPPARIHKAAGGLRGRAGCH